VDTAVEATRLIRQGTVTARVAVHHYTTTIRTMEATATACYNNSWCDYVHLARIKPPSGGPRGPAPAQLPKAPRALTWALMVVGVALVRAASAATAAACTAAASTASPPCPPHPSHLSCRHRDGRQR
jgi:hypothetical protein